MSWQRSVCPHDCPDTCGLLVKVDHGRVVSIKGDPDHPFTRGAICTKVRHYPDRIYSPLRVRHPLRRNGPKGEGRFQQISWDEALDEIVYRYRDIVSTDGPEAILPYSYAGTMGVVQFHAGHPFFHRLGASRLLRTICSATAEAGFAASLGSAPTTDIESTVHSDLIIIWGSNTLSTNMHAWPFFLKARQQGARIIVIDPYRNRTAARADLHLKIRPGTDAALALGIMNVLIREGLVNERFIAQQTIGFTRLAARVADYLPSRAAEITGIPSQHITDLAREYGKARAPYIRLGWGPARQLRGGMAMRTIALLPALVAAFEKEGGGVTRSTAAAFAFDMQAVMQDRLAPPNCRIVNMVRLGEALTELNEPPVKALHVYHCNPAVVAPDSRRVLSGLGRDDLFLVVHEHVLTETALHADIVLPSTTFLESTDIYRSYGHYYLQLATPVIEPEGEARSTLTIFQDLARRFGFQESCFQETEVDRIRNLLASGSPYLEGVTLERLMERRPIRLTVPKNPFDAGFATPSGKVEFHSEAMARMGLDPLPDGTPSRDVEGEGRYPLQLITPPRHYFLNSTFNEIDTLRNRAGKPTLIIHPEDASDRGIEEGMAVRVFNDRGGCTLFAQVTDRPLRGVVVIEGLYWPRFMPENLGINQLTSQALADMGESCAFHCNLVEVAPVRSTEEASAPEPWDGQIPKL